MRNKFVWLSVLSLGFAIISGGGSAAAKEFSPLASMKVGIIDVKTAVENTAEHQKGQKRLESLKAKKLKELESLRSRISQAEKDLLGQSMAMSPDRLAQKQQELKELRKDFSRKQQDAQEELSASSNRLAQGILGKFFKIVKDYGKNNKFDLILPKSAVLYSGPKLDVTADITEQLDKKK
ncbi:MAG: OmpH family outer membrane protein [Mariprofundaceae bacterium]